MPVYGSVGYCPCGQEIWLEYLRKEQGQGLGQGGGWTPRFSDAAGRKISHCPACGRELREEELDSR